MKVVGKVQKYDEMVYKGPKIIQLKSQKKTPPCSGDKIDDAIPKWKGFLQKAHWSRAIKKLFSSF